MSEEQQQIQELSEVMKVRREKLAQIKESGVNPFTYSYERSNNAIDILEHFDKFENNTVSLAGRIMAVRKMGKASFAHIMDATARIQTYIRIDDTYANCNFDFDNWIK